MQTRIGQHQPKKTTTAQQEYQNPLASGKPSESELTRLLNEWSDITPKYHQENLDDVEKLLRLFDNKTEFGPAGGISRLERFNRAEGLGKQPPQIVKTLLVENPSYGNSAFD